MTNTHRASCICGAVALEASGEPLDMGYCHCEACRRYCGAPLSAFTLWKPETVRITQGAEHLGRYTSSPMSDRRYCTRCGTHLIVDHPSLGLTDIRAVLPTLNFRPSVHLNYEETVLPIKDGLPKLRDFPAAIGGTGETLPE